MSELVVGRAQVIEFAETAIRQARQHYGPAAAGVRVEQLLRETARTVPAVLVGGWVSPECGCLVGSAFPRLCADLLSDDEDVSDTANAQLDEAGLLWLGLYFNEELCAHLVDTGQTFNESVELAVKVVD